MTDAASLLEGLDDEQRLVATTLLGPVCVLAGAGTGKTRALTHRIAYGVATGVYDPDRVLALTFTSRAAGELRARLRALGAAGVSARTFHSAALEQLTAFWPQTVGGPLPKVLAGKAQLLGQVAEALRLRVDQASLRDLAGEIEWRKVRDLSIEEYARLAPSRALPPGLSVDAVLAVHQRYEQLTAERRQLDFEDVLLVAAGMLADEPRVADQVRARFRFLLVDEYQDVSPLQQTLLDLWLGPRTDLCVVGDASQTIYSFTGASDEFLLGFGARYPEAVVVRLERNHRSAPPVLDVANRLMRGRPGALELRAATDATEAVPVPPPTEYPDDAAEARGVADAVVRELADGVAPERIAVLYRTNAQVLPLEQALAERGVASRQLGGTKFFDLEAVKRAVLELRSLAAESAQRASLGRGAPASLYQQVSDVARHLGWRIDPPETGGAVRDAWSALGAIVELADRAPQGATLAAFVEELLDRQAAEHEPVVAAVVLSTIHGAKGLEWDAVHVVGLSEGLLPIAHARGLAAIDEERRLLYVAVTRARRLLTLSWAREGLRGQRREPSRFLAELRTGSRGGGTTPAQ